MFVLLATALWTITSISAQRGVSNGEPVFEVASIKASPGQTRESVLAAFGSRSVTVEPGGRWVVRHATLRAIVQAIYPEYSLPGRIVGGPSWLDGQHFNIEARTAPETSPDQIAQMARRLLADRFRLKLGMENRPVEVYALVVARNDRRLGPGVASTVDCAPQGTPAVGRPPCRLVPVMENGVLVLKSGASPISDLITWLQMRVSRPIVDRTDLSGEFAIRFDAPPGAPLTATPSGSVPLPSTGADIFTAVREQLGLSLEARKEPVSVLIIEHVEMPSAN